MSYSTVGGWPDAHGYIAWARAQGCTAEVRAVPHQGQPLHAVTITAPSGRSALEIVLELEDPLMTTTVARLDRRLGLKSTLFT